MPRRAEARPAGRLRHPSRPVGALCRARRGGVCGPIAPRKWFRVFLRCNPANLHTPTLGESMLGALRRAPAVSSVGSTGARLLPRQQVRSMGAGGPRGYGSGEYRGLKVPKPERWQSNVATFYGTMMWLWIFHRARHDGKAMLVRQAARTRSGRVRLLPWVLRAETPCSRADLCCAPLRRVSSIPGTRIIDLSAPSCALRAATALVCRLGHGGAIDCSLCAWRVW